MSGGGKQYLRNSKRVRRIRKLENMPRLYFPAKPFSPTQAWGIKNPAYEQFGFSRHNGEDFRLGKDKKLYWPLEDCIVYDVAFGTATGWRIKANSQDEYTFADGKKAFLNVIMMHMESMSPVAVGTTLNVGDYCGIPDNTGFSTGPHTHFMLRRIDKDGKLIDKNDADNSIDPHLYWTGICAVDYNSILSLYGRIKLLLESYLKST
jgi:hypothetical protein